jgi:7,8-dihydropterin-6-yl-methyl-4-(beta-D-ribofuranosyl)aminobenzene 5'-phosphate synthase
MSRLRSAIVPFTAAIFLSCSGSPKRTEVAAPEVPTRTNKVKVADRGNSITNLYDAFGPKTVGTVHDFGFSALVRYRGKTILFDAGTNADILKQNVEALGVDLREVDFAVASHSHFDHISGFDYLLEVNPKVKIYFPADPFWGAPLPFDATGTDASAVDALPEEQRYFGGEKSKFTFQSSGRFWKANVEFISDHQEIAPGINLVATRSPYMGYFSRYPNTGIGGEVDTAEIKQLGLPELSLSLDTTEGEVLLVGCSHSRVDTIASSAKSQLAKDIYMIYGGYHLLPYKEAEIMSIATRLKDEIGVRQVAPAHCTGHLGFRVFKELYGNAYHLAGLATRIALPE